MNIYLDVAGETAPLSSRTIGRDSQEIALLTPNRVLKKPVDFIIAACEFPYIFNVRINSNGFESRWASYVAL